MNEDPGMLMGDPGMIIRDHGMLMRDHGMLMQIHGVIIRDHGMLMRDHGMIIQKRTAGIALSIYLPLYTILEIHLGCTIGKYILLFEKALSHYL